MANLSNIGRIFFGAAIAGIGVPVIYYKDLPYMLVPPKDYGIPGSLIIAAGFVFILIGACMVFKIKIRPVSFVFGCVLLLIFCFLFIPYMFSANANYRHLTEWENSLKELDFAGGAFLVAGCFPGKNKNTGKRVLGAADPLRNHFVCYTRHQLWHSPFSVRETGGVHGTVLDTRPCILGLFCRCRIAWFSYRYSFEYQETDDRDSFGGHDIYLVYHPAYPPRCGYSHCGC